MFEMWTISCIIRHQNISTSENVFRLIFWIIHFEKVLAWNFLKKYCHLLNLEKRVSIDYFHNFYNATMSKSINTHQILTSTSRLMYSWRVRRWSGYVFEQVLGPVSTNSLNEDPRETWVYLKAPGTPIDKTRTHLDKNRTLYEKRKIWKDKRKYEKYENCKPIWVEMKKNIYLKMKNKAIWKKQDLFGKPLTQSENQAQNQDQMENTSQLKTQDPFKKSSTHL